MNCKLHKSHKPIDCVIGFENMEKKLRRSRKLELNSCLWSPKLTRASQLLLYRLREAQARRQNSPFEGYILYNIVYYTDIACISHNAVGRSRSVKKYNGPGLSVAGIWRSCFWLNARQCFAQWRV